MLRCIRGFAGASFLNCRIRWVRMLVWLLISWILFLGYIRGAIQYAGFLQWGLYTNVWIFWKNLVHVRRRCYTRGGYAHGITVFSLDIINRFVMCWPLKTCFGLPLVRFHIGLGQMGIMAHFHQCLGLWVILNRRRPILNWPTTYKINLKTYRKGKNQILSNERA